MRVYCPDCGEKAHIITRKRLSVEVADIYCACPNVECGHTFVSTLSFKNSITPSRTSSFKEIKRLIGAMSASEVSQLFQDLKTLK